MPIVNIDAGWLNELLEKPHTPEELTEALEQIGCDVEDVVDIARHRCPQCRSLVEASLGADTVKTCTVCGHCQETPFELVDTMTAIRLDLLAARPDLFDIAGLSRALKGYLGETFGLPNFTYETSELQVRVDASVADPTSYRPAFGCAVAVMPQPLDDRMLVAVMKMQENLHWGVGRDRKLAAIGVHDLDAISGPVVYTTIDPDNDLFEPLAMPKRMSGNSIVKHHPKGIAYAHLLAGLERFPALLDATGRVMSMPPIINSERTKLTIGSQRLFIDVTGISRAAVDNALNTLVCALMELGAIIQCIRLKDLDGDRLCPNLTPHSTEIDLAKAKQWLGLPLDADSLVKSLRRMRLDVVPMDSTNTRFTVKYPAFRSDIRHMVDVFEDVAIGYGYQRIVPSLVPTMTVGGPRAEERISERARDVMIGLGFSEIMSLPLTTEQDHFERLRFATSPRFPRVANPKLKALTVLRTHLMTGVIQAMHENKRRQMPIRLFEIDNVALVDDTAPTSSREQRRLCFAEMGREAGYASVRSLLDALLRELGETGTFVPCHEPCFMEGRAATFTAGSIRGKLGELHPEVILSFGLDHPVALVELTLTEIENLAVDPLEIAK